jgi:hypothetical protein
MSISEILKTGESGRGTARRRASHQDRVDDEPSIAIVREDIYAVLTARETMGFVERVDRVFVALHGPDLARAVEVGQSLRWDSAVSMVQLAYRTRD